MNTTTQELAQLLEQAAQAQHDQERDRILDEFEGRYAKIEDTKESWKVFRALRDLYDAAEARDPRAFAQAKREAGI